MLINGIPTETLSARDRGLAYGDGHFTTMLVREGKVLWWQDHLARLQHANARLGFGEHSWDLLADEAAPVGGDMTAQAVTRPLASSLWHLILSIIMIGSKPASMPWYASSSLGTVPCSPVSRRWGASNK